MENSGRSLRIPLKDETSGGVSVYATEEKEVAPRRRHEEQRYEQGSGGQEEMRKQPPALTASGYTEKEQKGREEASRIQPEGREPAIELLVNEAGLHEWATRLESWEQDLIRCKEALDHREQGLRERENKMEADIQQARYERKAEDIVQRHTEEKASRSKAEIKNQDKPLQCRAQHKVNDDTARVHGVAPPSSFSHSILNPSGAFSSASAAYSSGRATSSASSAIHSHGKSSLSFLPSSASKSSYDQAANSAWSINSRPTAPASSNSSTSNRTAKADSHKTKPSAWKAPNTGTGAPPSASAGANPHAAGPPEDEAEWQRRQEEFSRKQQEKFRQDSLKQEQERMVNAADKTQTTQIHDAWKAYEAEWSSLNDRPVLYFRTFPWPIVGSPQKPEDLTKAAISAFMLAGPSARDSALDKTRERIRVQQLRWHPDRFNPRWLSKVDAHDRDNVQGSVVEVAGVLNELKEIVARKIAEQANK